MEDGCFHAHAFVVVVTVVVIMIMVVVVVMAAVVMFMPIVMVAIMLVSVMIVTIVVVIVFVVMLVVVFVVVVMPIMVMPIMIVPIVVVDMSTLVLGFHLHIAIIDVVEAVVILHEGTFILLDDPIPIHQHLVPMFMNTFIFVAMLHVLIAHQALDILTHQFPTNAVLFFHIIQRELLSAPLRHQSMRVRASRV